MTYNLEWLVQQYAPFFEKFGISHDDLIAHYVIWREQTNDESVTNYLWYLFHVLLGETKKQVTNPGDYHRNLHDIYLMMLAFRANVEEQKDNQLVQLIIKNRIQLWQRELAYPFRLQAVSLHCCPYCEQINGQVFEVEEVLENLHFASEQCSNAQGCSCGYIPVMATENN